MISIVSGTNRINSYTLRLAHYYQENLLNQGIESQIIDLTQLPEDFIFSSLYKSNQNQTKGFLEFQTKIDNSDKLIFIIPEYNGSYPGVLKSFIDGLRYPDSLDGKVVAITGISASIQGGTLALSHFSDVLHYLNAIILPIQPKIGQISKELMDGKIQSDKINILIKNQIMQLLNFKTDVTLSQYINLK
jgi:NAD(P)H-dependent FMN reductase